MKNNKGQKTLRQYIRECIIVGGDTTRGYVLGKTRDRNYKPTVQIIRDITSKGIEFVYMHDMNTDYAEGMNCHGVGIVNAALLVSADEKALKHWRIGTSKKKGASNDGPRMLHALQFPKLSQAIKSLVGYDSGLKGHTLVGNKKLLYSIEMTSKHNPIVKKIDTTKGFDVKTNHGEEHHSAGYTANKHPDDYASSAHRQAQALDALKNVKDDRDIMPNLTTQKFKKNSNYNMLRTTAQMRTSSQVLMHLEDLTFTFYVIDDECDYKGIVDHTPKEHKSRINIIIEKI